MAGTDEPRTAYYPTTSGPNGTYGQAKWTATTSDRTAVNPGEYGPSCPFVPGQDATGSEALLAVPERRAEGRCDSYPGIRGARSRWLRQSMGSDYDDSRRYIRMDVGCGPLALLLAAIVAIGGLVLFMPDEGRSDGTAGPVIVEEVSPSP